MEKEGEGTVRGVGGRFLTDTTVGGVRRAARPPLPSRIIWIIIIVVCVAMAIFSVVRLVDVRERRRRAVTSVLDVTRSVTFPDVTVCDVRAVRLSLAARGTSQGQEWLALANTLRVGQALNTQNETQNVALRHQYQTLLDNLTSAERDQVSFNLQRGLADCTLGDVPCQNGNFTRFFHDKYGYCYTFSPHPAHQDILMTGPQHGLRLELRTTLGDLAQEEAGFVIGVHQSRDTLFLPEEGVFVSGGQVTYLGLSQNTQTVDSDCVSDEEEDRNSTNLYSADTGWRYSRRGCQHGCLQRELVSRCSCCDLDLPCPSSFLQPTSSTPSAGFVAANRCLTLGEMSCRTDVLQSYTEGSLPCLTECLPRCRQTTYSMKTSMSSLLAVEGRVVGEGQPTLFGAAARALQSQETAAQQPRAAESPVTEQPLPLSRRKRQIIGALTNLQAVQIYVYFDDLRSRTAHTAEDTDWSEWMADVGGLLSLWLGLSVLGVIEILSFFLDLALFACCRPKPTMVTAINPE